MLFEWKKVYHVRNKKTNCSWDAEIGEDFDWKNNYLGVRRVRILLTMSRAKESGQGEGMGLADVGLP